ncbi:MAG: hypothetical protein A2350_08480, partial [Candidatus Raymondbacteria bacterium RifOxyB12_full_50_8]
MSVSGQQAFSATIEIELSDSEFDLIRGFVHEKCGINIQSHKKALVKSRLSKRLHSFGFGSFKEYYKYAIEDKSGHEVVEMLDALSTNVTQFFRENHHFSFLEGNVIPDLKARMRKREFNKVRIWSAACSTGEEVYSLAITMFEYWPEMTAYDVMILGTDISTHVLKVAEDGVYNEEKLKPVSSGQRLKYFEKDGDWYRVKEFVKKKTLFRRMNLIAKEFPFKNPLNVIFCRNVLIYFDKPTQ